MNLRQPAQLVLFLYAIFASFINPMGAQTPDISSCATKPIIASKVSVKATKLSVPTVSIFFAVYGGNAGSPRINTLELSLAGSDFYNIEGVDLDFVVDSREYSVGLQMSYEQDDWMPNMFAPTENGSWGLAPTFVSIMKDAHNVAFSINSEEGEILIDLSEQELFSIQSGLADCID